MQRIRVLRNTGQNLPRLAEGQVVDVPDDTADLLCRLNLAVLLKAIPSEPLAAIPENPTIQAAEEKLEEIKDRWTKEPPLRSKRQKAKLDPKEQ